MEAALSLVDAKFSQVGEWLVSKASPLVVGLHLAPMAADFARQMTAVTMKKAELSKAATAFEHANRVYLAILDMHVNCLRLSLQANAFLLVGNFLQAAQHLYGRHVHRQRLSAPLVYEEEGEFARQDRCEDVIEV
ncbi:hypothetical protein EON64_05280 [archaeon]|nr:MAG: hypothetical protein EON64_05280 [archaeon]